MTFGDDSQAGDADLDTALQQDARPERPSGLPRHNHGSNLS
eukprot:CAMPEP_0185590482 /NCGR_PEP_ID=MMETSP0434-20130131/60921_1 /TAXON_ID=626734 ORGANISM="Favella taraikaensis, Strain Fe Narragansett Bay" /NCGR_SAMPLE_ID=MMETSP0434 /ASSEMBLY_ACC=CAM_ASM_000379 /LENGTH=40 /DNA_ID= /DNA_START= /DNA_END= /DNA_ORIENTATION=